MRGGPENTRRMIASVKLYPFKEEETFLHGFKEQTQDACLISVHGTSQLNYWGGPRGLIK